MKIIMIKKKGCNPCKMFEPTIKSMADQNQLEYKSVLRFFNNGNFFLKLLITEIDMFT